VKRGNTALKRVVSVASVAAMAIAGAVVAAPAASAALPTTTDVVRAQPIANADQIGVNGNKLAAGTGLGTTYSGLPATAGTGNVPTVTAGVKSQRISNLQVKIPASNGTKPWELGESITVTLPADVKFNGTPSVGISTSAVALGDLSTKITAAAISPVEGAQSPQYTATVSGNVLTIRFTADAAASPAAVTAGSGYVVTVGGIYVDVADTFVGSDAPIWADVATATTDTPGPAVATAVGSTTLGYVSGLSVDAAGSYAANAKTITVPDITLTENVKAALAATGYTLTVSSDPAAPAATPLAVTNLGKFTVSGSTSSAPAAATAAAASGTTAVVVTPTAIDNNAIETVTLSGLQVKNVPDDAKIVVTLTDPSGAAINQQAVHTGATASAFSFTPDQFVKASVTIASEVNPPRTAGNNRYETASLIAQEGTWSRTAVVLANGLDVKSGVDALSANFLAGAKTAPILLTDSSDTLPTATQLALTRLFSGQTGDLTIYVLGKTDSVSQAAQDSALAVVKAAASSAAKVTVVNVAGNNRYETSAAVVGNASSAVRSYDLGAGSFKTAFLASGIVNADALAAGGFSAGAGIPVLLVADGAKALDESVAKAITDQHIGQVVVLGSTDRVSDEVVAQLKDKLGVSNVVRKAGTDRFITAADVNTMAFKAAPDGLGLALADDTAYLANGLGGWADALTVGPLAGQQTAPLLTVPINSLPSATQSFLSTNKANISAIEALGQSDRIADSVITAAQAAIK